MAWDSEALLLSILFGRWRALLGRVLSINDEWYENRAFNVFYIYTFSKILKHINFFILHTKVAWVDTINAWVKIQQ